MTNASAVELEGLKRLPSHRSGDDQLSLPKLVLAHFLRGEERAAEAAARLAGESGYSLAEVYETLRRGIYGTIADVREVHALTSNELDDQLTRLAARLRPPADRHRSPQAMVLSTVRGGVTASICHLFESQGVPAIALEMCVLARHATGGQAVSRQFPAVRYIAVDGDHAKPQELVHLAGTLSQLNLVSERGSVAVLGDDPAAVEGARMQRLPHVSFVASLPALMQAVGLPSENPLTTRERAVVEHIADGSTNLQIAHTLGISIATVKTYLERAQCKLKSSDRASSVAAAMRRGWI
jgi:DNA-binding CsgD family transcriptional regulator